MRLFFGQNNASAFFGFLIFSILYLAFFVWSRFDSIQLHVDAFGFWRIPIALGALVLAPLLFNNLLNSLNLTERKTYLPAVIGLILISRPMPIESLYNTTVTLVFIVLILRLLMQISEDRINVRLLLDAGLLTGIALIFTPVPTVLFLSVILALLYFDKLVLRKVLVFLSGAAIIYFLFWEVLFLLDIEYPWFQITINQGKISNIEWSDYLAFLLPILLLFLSTILSFGRMLTYNKVRIRLSFATIQWTFGLLFLASMFTSANFWEDSLYLASFLVPFFTVHIYRMKRTWLAELMLWILLAVCAYNLWVG